METLGTMQLMQFTRPNYITNHELVLRRPPQNLSRQVWARNLKPQLHAATRYIPVHASKGMTIAESGPAADPQRRQGDEQLSVLHYYNDILKGA